jgi:hypothetical protein
MMRHGRIPATEYVSVKMSDNRRGSARTWPDFYGPWSQLGRRFAAAQHRAVVP